VCVVVNLCFYYFFMIFLFVASRGSLFGLLAYLSSNTGKPFISFICLNWSSFKFSLI
jgi:hypothetical protein